MPRGKPFNPNTKYGRRKIREDFQRRYEAMSPKERSELDGDVLWGRLVLFLIVIIVCIIIVANGGKIK